MNNKIVRIETKEVFRKDRNCFETKKIYVINCSICSSEIKTPNPEKRSNKCSSCLRKGQIAWNKGKSNEKIKGKKSPNWKGGKYKSSDGYVMVKVKERLETDSPWESYKREHTYIMEQHLGRSLSKGEIVHHIDKDKLHNDLNNLILTSQKEHRRMHNELELLSIELYKKGFIVFDKTDNSYKFTKEFKNLCKLD